MAAAPPRRGNLKRTRHERGDLRRKKLIRAAADLVESTPVSKIRLSDVAKKAGIPLASARHFYKNKHEMLLAILGAAYPDWFETLRSKAFSAQPESWQELSDTLVDATVAFWERHPVVMKILRGSLAGELARAEIRGDKDFSAPFVRALFAAHFEIPTISDDAPDVFLIYTKLIDSVFSIGIFEHGGITDRFIEEAKSVARGYLSLYFPRYLPKKTLVSDVPTQTHELQLGKILN